PVAADAWAEGAVPSLRVCPAPGHGEVSSTDTDAAPSEADGGDVPPPSPTPLEQDEVLDAPQPPERGSGSPPVPALLPAPPSRNTARPRRLPGVKHPEPRVWTEVRDAAEADGHGVPQPPSRSDLMKIWARRSPRTEVKACDGRSTAPRPGSSRSLVLGSLLDTVRLAPGVTIRHGGSEERRLCLPVRREDVEEETGEAKKDLRPLRPTVPFPAIAVSQVTGDGTP
ncbi:uncharacterized protein LOC109364589, partial [Meleagris gallopavo]|uniref:uncharacterized protein LOC109364589 n=1 Tax=Meleagris gallopavo TaxID=9103 RepID=UPI00093B74E2